MIDVRTILMPRVPEVRYSVLCTETKGMNDVNEMQEMNLQN